MTCLIHREFPQLLLKLVYRCRLWWSTFLLYIEFRVFFCWEIGEHSRITMSKFYTHHYKFRNSLQMKHLVLYQELDYVGLEIQYVNLCCSFCKSGAGLKILYWLDLCFLETSYCSKDNLRTSIQFLWKAYWALLWKGSLLYFHIPCSPLTLMIVQKVS